MILYDNTECSDPPLTTYALGNETLANHLCYEGISNTGLVQYIARYYVHQNYDDASSGSEVITTTANSRASSRTAAIIGGVVVGFVVVLAITAFGIHRNQQKRKRHQMEETLVVMEARFTGPDTVYRRHDKTDHNSSSRTTLQGIELGMMILLWQLGFHVIK